MATTSMSATAYKPNPLGPRSGACSELKSRPSATRIRAARVAPVPKLIPDEVRLRAVALFLELKNAERAARALLGEYPDNPVHPKSIRGWAKGFKVDSHRGRPVGTPGNTEKTSPLRARVLELWADGKGMPQAEIARAVGTTRQNVFNLINRT